MLILGKSLFSIKAKHMYTLKLLDLINHITFQNGFHLIFSNLQNTNLQNMSRWKAISNLNITSSILHHKTEINQFKTIFKTVHH